MMDKYPGMSPYHYCHWNPINRTDDNGMFDDEWEINKYGEIIGRTENPNYDCVHVVDDEGMVITSSNYYECGTISELTIEGDNNVSFSVCGFANAKEFFEFLAAQYSKECGSPIEWAHGTIVNQDPTSLVLTNDDLNIITTTHKSASVDVGIWLNNGYVISRQAHNHPAGTKKPSDIIEKDGRRHGDIPTALTFEKKYPMVKNYFYIPGWGYSRYDSMGSIDPRVINWGTVPSFIDENDVR